MEEFYPFLRNQAKSVSSITLETSFQPPSSIKTLLWFSKENQQRTLTGSWGGTRGALSSSKRAELMARAHTYAHTQRHARHTHYKMCMCLKVRPAFICTISGRGPNQGSITFCPVARWVWYCTLQHITVSLTWNVHLFVLIMSLCVCVRAYLCVCVIAQNSRPSECCTLIVRLGILAAP